MGFTAIVVPVPELEAVVRPRLERDLPQYVFAHPGAVHAHVTLLGPFVERRAVDATLLEELAGFFEGVAPFGFGLGPVHVFDDGAVVLRPDPSGGFLDLTRRLVERYPGFPPNGVPLERFVPHLTLKYGPAGTGEEVPGDLSPIRATADHAVLNWYEPYACAVLARFPWGG